MTTSVHLKFIVCVAVFASIVAICLACNGYELKINEIKNCAGPDAVIEIDDGFTVDLDSECNLVAKGCGRTKGFKTAKSHYRAEKKPFPVMEGDVDICEAAEKYGAFIDPFIGMLGLPSRCPVKPMEYCLDGSKKFNIAKFKSRLGLAVGKTDILLNSTHDTGNSCIHINFELMKPKRG